ncbi:hypothetical protein [Streptomyces yunnanensis]|nr:hypothetical protein [Streptomyces yunnanensis]
MNVLSAMLPEFLGSLLSGTVLGVTSWCLRRRRHRNAIQPNPERNDTPPD